MIAGGSFSFRKRVCLQASVWWSFLFCCFLICACIMCRPLSCNSSFSGAWRNSTGAATLQRSRNLRTTQKCCWWCVLAPRLTPSQSCSFSCPGSYVCRWRGDTRSHWWPANQRGGLLLEPIKCGGLFLLRYSPRPNERLVIVDFVAGFTLCCAALQSQYIAKHSSLFFASALFTKHFIPLLQVWPHIKSWRSPAFSRMRRFSCCSFSRNLFCKANSTHDVLHIRRTLKSWNFEDWFGRGL